MSEIAKKLPKASLSELIAHWRLQESLFQGYRRLLLTLQTILLSIAALSISKNLNPISAGIILVSLLGVSVVIANTLQPIIKKRGDVVFYWQAKIIKAEEGKPVFAPLTEMKVFQKNDDHPLYFDDDYTNLSKGKNRTRGKLDKLLPNVIWIAWAGLVLAFLLNLWL